jgi:phosphoribosylglycinamide formyltransferase 1
MTEGTPRTPDVRPLRTAVLLSGSGRTLANLIEHTRRAALPVEIVHVVSSRRNVRGIELAEKAGLPVTVLARKSFPGAPEFSAALTKVLHLAAPELVVMAGFLSMYELPAELAGRVINIHPSLLPLFGGRGFFGHHVHEAVIAAGMRVSGCTVHFVDNVFDHGPIILQRACPVLPSDDADLLAARVFQQELLALPQAIDWIARGWVRCEQGRVVFAPEVSDQRWW